MTVYFAGGSHYEWLADKPILESFWYKRNAEKAMKHTDHFFLDSGAFTAFTKDVEIDVNEYATFIHENKERITVASSLDAIGNPEKSYELYRELRRLDCDVIPVFHCREDEKWLIKYLDEGVAYLALGGMVPESTPYKLEWLDRLFGKYLTNSDGTPRVKVHGFGLTVGTLIERYPWFSVDSTTWLNGARFGTILMNFPGRRIVHVAVSARNPSVRQINSTHFDRLPPMERAIAENLLARAGTTLADLQQTDALLRFNTWSFEQWERDYGFPTRFTTSISEGLFE